MEGGRGGGEVGQHGDIHRVQIELSRTNLQGHTKERRSIVPPVLKI